MILSLRRQLLILFIMVLAITANAQLNSKKLFADCKVQGSTTIYDLKKRKWFYTDSADAQVASLPASTFKIINLLIALETGVIKDEHEVVKWPGKTDTSLYGYRPEIYKDMTVEGAFRVSAGWAFMELAARIGKERYRHYLKLAGYGNSNLSAAGVDFWNYGNFAITPINQVQFLQKVLEGKSPFSSRNIAILKRVMLTEETLNQKVFSKTGWTRPNGKDIGWWVGYVVRKNNTYIFATRINKDRSSWSYNFSECRKDITRKIMKQLKMLD